MSDKFKWKGSARMIRFTVHGTPGPQGSKRILPLGGKVGGRSIMVESSKLVAPWRKIVAYEAQRAMARGKHEKIRGQVEIAIIFYLKRPKKHFRAGGELRADAPDLVQTKPDLSKLVRSTEDAITGICYVDDAQISRMIIEKRYGEATGADIVIRETQPPATHRPADVLLVLAYGAASVPAGGGDE